MGTKKTELQVQINVNQTFDSNHEPDIETKAIQRPKGTAFSYSICFPHLLLCTRFFQLFFLLLGFCQRFSLFLLSCQVQFRTSPNQCSNERYRLKHGQKRVRVTYGCASHQVLQTNGLLKASISIYQNTSSSLMIHQL